jgi:SAM-dependent methyltransferase
VSNDFVYQGSELDVFAQAINWKSYWKSKVQKFIRGDVLEVGAGLGGTTKVLLDSSHTSWVCLEPDPQLAAQLSQLIGDGAVSADIRVQIGSIADLQPETYFDTMLYIDVLEHIEDDRQEMVRAAERLKPGGHLIVLCPAHLFLYSPFDRAIGHFRRYNKSMYRAVTPPGTKLVYLKYLDSLGMLLSLANRLLLKSSSPSQKQINFWDRRVVPCSRIMDPLTIGLLGKTILGVWRRETA